MEYTFYTRIGHTPCSSAEPYNTVDARPGVGNLLWRKSQKLKFTNFPSFLRAPNFFISIYGIWIGFFLF